MTLRRLLLFGLLAGLIALGACVWLLWPRTAITRENAAKIREGMTLAEVQAILGGPERNESSGPLCPDEPDGEAGEFVASWYQDMKLMEGRHVWGSDKIIIVLRVENDGKVSSPSCIPMRRMNESPLEILRRWLNL